MALAVIVLLLVIVVAVSPFGPVELPFSAPLLASMQTLITGADLIVAALLYSQFAVLGGGRCFGWRAAISTRPSICAVHYLSYPGVLSPAGAFGSQTTGWLFVAWHGALPIAVIAYAFRQGKDRDEARTDQPTLRAIGFNACATVALACGIVGLTMLANNDLPPLFTDTRHLTPFGRAVNAALAPLLAAALAALWARRRSVLDLWLSVMLAAWLIAIVYAILFVGVRFSVAFYVVRAYWLFTALLILLILLWESTTLYARLAYSIVLSRRQRVTQAVTVDAMSASFAHELSQPVAAMIANGEAALLWLNRAPPDLGKVRSSLEQVSGDGRRASRGDRQRTSNVSRQRRAKGPSRHQSCHPRGSGDRGQAAPRLGRAT